MLIVQTVGLIGAIINSVYCFSQIGPSAGMGWLMSAILLLGIIVGEYDA